MKKRLIGTITILIIIIISFIFVQKTMYCTDISHKNAYPVNPFCTTCRQINGIIQHECKNPNGEEIYCPSCGKIAKY